MSAADAARFALFASSAEAYNLFKQFCDDNQIFTTALSDKLGDVEHNPIADYYRYPGVCKTMSSIGQINDFTQIRNTLINNGVPPQAADSIAVLVFKK